MKQTFCFLILLVLCAFNLYSQQRFEYEYGQMGTQIRLVFYATNKQNADFLAGMAFNKIDKLNNILSDYVQDSELNILVESTNEPVHISNELFNILKKSDSISKVTEGAFDVTAGPLVKLWRRVRKSKTLPTNVEIVDAQNRVGYKKIKFPKANTVVLTNEGMKLDVGGIGKGFTADVVIRFLTSQGITSALVDMGGDICVSEPPPDKENWMLAFSYYNRAGIEEVKRIKLKNGAVATSGDLYQFVEINGKRYSHIINPLSGMALTNSIQVTVIAKDGAEADAFASALSVMGIERANIVLPKLENIHAFIIESKSGSYKSWASPKFNSHFDAE